MKQIIKITSHNICFKNALVCVNPIGSPSHALYHITFDLKIHEIQQPNLLIGHLLAFSVDFVEKELVCKCICY